MSTPNKPVVRFQRANYVVNDLDRALSFYCDILGMSIAFTKESPADSYSYDVFDITPGQPMRFAVLNTETQLRVMAVTELKNQELAPVPKPRRAAIVMEISDIDGVIERAQAAGCHVYPESVLNTHDGRVGRELGLVDFDDNLVVIYYIPPTSG